jgi:exopolyphosphatase/pppGpp-phosphohydrolase
VLFALPKLARAEIYGGIEVGAKGVKATVIEVLDPANIDLKVLLTATVNTTLSAGLLQSERFDPSAVHETAVAVREFSERIRREYRVSAKGIFLVGSSGLFSAIEAKPGQVSANQAALSDALHEATGQRIAFLNVVREVELSFVGTVPRASVDTALLVDVGSGNTKGGLREGARIATFSMPFGSVSLTDFANRRARESGIGFPEASDALRSDQVLPALKKQLAVLPEMDRRKHVYLSGGAIWALATFARAQDQGAYVRLRRSDAEEYRRLLRSVASGVPTPDISALPESTREQAMKEIRRVKDTFTRENLLAGAEIVQAIFDELSAASPDREFFFARNGYVGWLAAYVREQSRATPK